MNRRRWLRLGAGAVLGTSLWPGCARFAGNGRGGNFRFIVLNDTHYFSPKCPAWFEHVRASVRSHAPRPDFCLMVGDLAEHGTSVELGAMRDVLQSFEMDFHVVIGNHDYASATDRAPWDQLFPNHLNYRFEHRGWQFVGLDSTQGTDWQKTRIPASTLNWADAQVKRLDAAAPTVLFTHFPIGAEVTYRPLNADDLLDRFGSINLVAAFNGHFHGLTERKHGNTVLTTNRCCAISRDNHDRSTEKGYFLCTAQEGTISREFIPVPPA